MYPNFFIVGAPKAGTTSLYNYLGQHPEIYMSPIKEPAFFAADLFEVKRQLGRPRADPDELRAYLDGPMTERRAGVIGEWEQYLRLFKNGHQKMAIGEASGNYLASSSAPGAIRERFPHARIIMLLRDPVHRLFSQHSQAVSRGQARSGFLQWVEEQLALEATLRPRLGAVWNGFYAQHLRRYLSHFPLDQIRTYLYEDYCKAPLAVLRDAFSFLRVDPGIAVDVSRRYNVTLQPRSMWLWNVTKPLRSALNNLVPRSVVSTLQIATHKRPPQITPLERAEVLKIYQQDIRELQGMIGRDLSAWLGA